MAIKPDKLPRWATVPSVDPIVGGSNVVEPPEQLKDDGWQRKQKPPANYQNWLHNLTYQWLQYFNTSGWQTGDIKATYRQPSDPDMDGVWVIMNDGSIGNAASGATTRANDDTEDLFILLWNNVADTYCPVSGGRGASASDDFAANKTLTLALSVGRAICNVGGSPTAFALGQSFGAQTHQLINSELSSHNHGLSPVLIQAGPGDLVEGGTRDTLLESSGTTQSTGGDQPHNNMQPSSFVNVYIKL